MANDNNIIMICYESMGTADPVVLPFLNVDENLHRCRHVVQDLRI